MRAGKRLNIASLNAHLICVICSGYYVEATTIVECLHTFCRSCIINYLKTNRFCPICDVQIHNSKPWSSLRADKTMQDLVYKLVPGLYQDEMRRRRQFYARVGEDAAAALEGEEKGFLPHGARFFAQDDSISLSLEYYSGQSAAAEGEERGSEKPKRYLQCPAAVTVRHLKKFLQMKYGIGVDSWVDIIYDDECLPEYFSLIDVAYTFAWRRTSPMRLSYRIFTKKAVKAVKPGNKFKTASIVDDGRKPAGKQSSSLEQQRQSEYLGNFNLNPTKSGFCRSQTNNSSLATSTLFGEGKSKALKEDSEVEDGSGDKMFPSSEDSNASGLRIISEKEESLKENSEESRESLPVDKRKESEAAVQNFSEEAVDGFATKKILKSKHKSECRKERKRHEVAHGEKRRKSATHAESSEESVKRVCPDSRKRRKSLLEGLEEEEDEKASRFVIRDRTEEEELEPLANLKNEALRKVFVMKDKAEGCAKAGKEEEVRRKKRKKSRHHEGEPKKKKVDVVPASPSILSFAKDPLKLKVKLTPIMKAGEEEEVGRKAAEREGREGEKEARAAEAGKEKEEAAKKTMSDKERLLHLRAVRHKNIIKTNVQSYISAPRSLTISKVDASEQQAVKPRIVESRPSLEIMLIPPADATKTKSAESMCEKKCESAASKEVMDTFGVLDLSEKSTRAKETTGSSPKEGSEGVERTKKSAQQSIMQIAQTLVNRKLSPMLPDKRFDSVSDPTTAAAAMRNLKTLSDTAVNILMAAQSKGFPASPESPKRSYPTVSASPPQKGLPLAGGPGVAAAAAAAAAAKDSENGGGGALKIPMFPVSRERANPIPPVPNLHEIYPKGRGRPVTSLTRLAPTPTPIKPGQNQTVRQIPNPSALLNRQNSQLLSRLPVPVPVPQGKFPENGDLSPPPKASNNSSKLSSIPPLQSIKSKMLVAAPEDPPDKLPVPKITNNNAKAVQNGADNGFLSGAVKGGEEAKKLAAKVTSNGSNLRRMESMARNIESVAAGLTARAVSNAMVDAK